MSGNAAATPLKTLSLPETLVWATYRGLYYADDSVTIMAHPRQGTQGALEIPIFVYPADRHAQLALLGTTVRLQHAATGQALEAELDEHGCARFHNMAPGTYQTAIRLPATMLEPAAARVDAAIQRLTALLQHAEAGVRRYAVQDLARMGTVAAPAAAKVIALLRDPEPTVRSSAFLALRAMGVDINETPSALATGRKATVQDLIVALYTGHGLVVSAVATALGRIRAAAAVPDLLTVLANADEAVLQFPSFVYVNPGLEVRSHRPKWLQAYSRRSFRSVVSSDLNVATRFSVPEALEAMGSQAVPDLVIALRNPRPPVRAAVAAVLGRIGGEAAIPDLLPALRDTSGEVRATAAKALGKIGGEVAIPALTIALRDPEGKVRQASAWALGALGAQEAVPALLPALRDTSGEVRATAAEALGKIGGEVAIPALTIALRDPEGRVRQASAWALGALGAQEAVPALLAALRDTSGEVRATAAEALGKIGAEAAVADLIAVLRIPDERAETETLAVIEAVWRIGLKAVPDLIALLQDTDMEMRRVAAGILGNLGGKEAIPDLVTALHDPEPWVRRAVAEALGVLQAEAAIPALVAALQDAVPPVRAAAAEGLRKIGLRAVPALIAALDDPAVRVRAAVAKALGALQAEAAIPTLIAALANPEPEVRAAAAEALGALQAEVAIPALMAALHDPEPEVRAAAAEALGVIQAEAAIPALIAALPDPEAEVRRAAAEALSEIGGEAATLHLLDMLNDPDEYLREFIARLLS